MFERALSIIVITVTALEDSVPLPHMHTYCAKENIVTLNVKPFCQESVFECHRLQSTAGLIYY